MQAIKSNQNQFRKKVYQGVMETTKVTINTLKTFIIAIIIPSTLLQYLMLQIRNKHSNQISKVILGVNLIKNAMKLITCMGYL